MKPNERIGLGIIYLTTIIFMSIVMMLCILNGYLMTGIIFLITIIIIIIVGGMVLI